MYRYWVKKSDGSVYYLGKTFAGPMYLLEELGKKDETIPMNEALAKPIDLTAGKGTSNETIEKVR